MDHRSDLGALGTRGQQDPSHLRFTGTFGEEGGNALWLTSQLAEFRDRQSVGAGLLSRGFDGIGDNVIISPAGKPDKLDHPSYFIRDGIVIVPKDGVIPHGTII